MRAALALQALDQGQLRGGFDGLDAAQRGEQAGHALLHFGALGGDRRGVALHLALAGAARDVAFGQQATDIGQAGFGEIAFDDPVEDAVLHSLRRFHRIAGDDHLQRPFDANQARQALGAAGTGQQADLHFRQADLGIDQGDAVMAGERHFQTAAQGGAVDHGDARLARGLDGLDYLRQRGRLRRLAEFLDVSAGHEGAAFADEHHGAHSGIRLGLAEGPQKSVADPMAQGVDRRIVDFDQGHVALALDPYHLGHARNLRCNFVV